MNDMTTADEILKSAWALVLAGGYNGFSYADIASEVGIRKPSIHHHFPTKADLVSVLVARYREEAEAGIAALEGQIPGPLERLGAYTGYWERCIADASAPFCICALLANELPVLPEAVAQEVKAFFRMLSGWLVTIFEDGLRHGDFVLANSPRVEAETFMATVHGAMLSARAYEDPAIFGAITASLLQRLSVQSHS